MTKTTTSDEHDCENGWIRDANSDDHGDTQRGDDTRRSDDDQHRRFRMKRCPKCAAAEFLRSIGREECTWERWNELPELAGQTRLLRNWRGGIAWSALLHGEDGFPNYGSGKTHAVIATAVDWIRRGRAVRYHFVPDLVDQARQAISDHSLNLGGFSEFQYLVVLDDLGAEARTDWTRELIDRVIDLRYRRRLPTLIASNLGLAELDARYPRALSRLSEGLRLVWSAPDQRRREE